jgi:mannose-6-phosphate isomerase-like protein (cupin superfamily)
MPASNIDILEAVRVNPNFRQELLTNEYSQVIEMNIESGSATGEQVCEGDAVLVIVEGCGEAVLNRQHSPVHSGSLVAVPAGTRHNIINTGSAPLKLFGLYAPPHEAPGTLYRTKTEALAAEDAVEARRNGDENVRYQLGDSLSTGRQ